MKLSVVIPARNEVGSIGAVIDATITTLERADVAWEIVVVDDGSSDGTAELIESLAENQPGLNVIRSPYSGGFGLAVKAGLEHFTGDAVAIMMADGSDDPSDLITYHGLLARGYDCAFGTRFSEGGKVYGYPWGKLVINRIANTVIRVLFGHRYDDTTNAFKAYRREVIDSVQPLLSHHFNLTVELPLKSIVRGHTYAVVPTSWQNRSAGRSKFAFQEMGSRYLFIVLYVFLEHHLSRGDYRRAGADRPRWRAGRPGAVPPAGSTGPDGGRTA